MKKLRRDPAYIFISTDWTGVHEVKGEKIGDKIISHSQPTLHWVKVSLDATIQQGAHS